MNKWLTCFAVAFALSMVGCDDSDSNDTDTPQKQCTADKCKDSSVLLQCKDGQTTEVKCGVGKTCTDNACKPVDPNAECTVAVCDENDPKKIKKCENNKFVDALCVDGEICEGGGCMKEFEIDAACFDPDGYGKCTADGNNAIVCHGNQIFVMLV